MRYNLKYMFLGGFILLLLFALLGCEDGTTGPELDYPSSEPTTEQNWDFSDFLTNVLEDPVERDITIYTTPGFDPASHPVLYLLHGFSQNNLSMMQQFEIDQVADYLVAQGRIGEMAIVMPDAYNKFGGSFYANSSIGPVNFGNYQDYILKADDGTVATIDPNCVIARAENHLYGSVLTDKSRRMIAGLSMGGYGAMKFAMMFPDFFASVSSHSGVLYFDDMENLISDVLRQNPRGLLMTGRVLNTGPASDATVATDTMLLSGIDPAIILGGEVQPTKWSSAIGWTTDENDLQFASFGTDPSNLGNPAVGGDEIPDYNYSPEDWSGVWEPGVWVLKLSESLPAGLSVDDFQPPDLSDPMLPNIPSWMWPISETELTDQVTMSRSFNCVKTDSTKVNFAYYLTRNHYTDYYIVSFNGIPIDTVGLDPRGVYTDGVVTSNADHIGLHYVTIDTGGAMVYREFKDNTGNTISKVTEIDGVPINNGENTILFHALCRIGQPTPLDPLGKSTSAFVFAMSLAFQPEIGAPQYELDPINSPGVGFSLPFNTKGETYETAWKTHWLTNDPYTMLDEYDLGSISKIMIDAGDNDQYRMNVHASWFSSKLNDLGIPHIYTRYTGQHGDKFYNRIAPMLEFHNGNPES